MNSVAGNAYTRPAQDQTSPNSRIYFYYMQRRREYQKCKIAVFKFSTILPLLSKVIHLIAPFSSMFVNGLS